MQTTPHGATAQAAANRTGLPNTLKTGVESLSGLNLNHVQVHYNSAQPAQLNAHAFAQGSHIHVGPGQEKHLPHEAWHVVQQAQGRVRPTLQMKLGVAVNDDQSLEREADVMGARALAEPTRPKTLAATSMATSQTHQLVSWKQLGLGALSVVGGVAAGVGAAAAGLAAAPAAAVGLAAGAAVAGIGYGAHRVHRHLAGRAANGIRNAQAPYADLDLDALERGDGTGMPQSTAPSLTTGTAEELRMQPAPARAHAASAAAVNPHAFGPAGAERWNLRGTEKWREFVDEAHAHHATGPLVYDRTGPGGHAGARTEGGGEPGALHSFLTADRQAQALLSEERPLTAADYAQLHGTLVAPVAARRAAARDYRDEPATWQTDSPMTAARQGNLTGLGLGVAPTGHGTQRITTGPAAATPGAWQARMQVHFDRYYQERAANPNLAAARLARQLDAEHAFNDGTGRVNRLMMNMMLTQAGGYPITMGHTNMPTEMSDADLATYLGTQQAATARLPGGDEADVNALGAGAQTVTTLHRDAAEATRTNDHFGAMLITHPQAGSLPKAERSLLGLTNQPRAAAAASSATAAGAASAAAAPHDRSSATDEKHFETSSADEFDFT